MVMLVIDICVNYMSMFFKFLANVPITDSISLLEFIFAFLIMSSVVYALINVVHVGASGAVGSFKRSRHRSFKRSRQRSFNDVNSSSSYTDDSLSDS